MSEAGESWNGGEAVGTIEIIHSLGIWLKFSKNRKLKIFDLKSGSERISEIMTIARTVASYVLANFFFTI